jgi:nucleotide-binding universal stress UspA family protein
MDRLSRICVGFHFTPQSDLALRSAATLARSFGAAIDVVTVVEPAPLYRRVLTPGQSRLASVDDLVARCRDRLEDATRVAGLEGLTVNRHVRVGRPFAELVVGCREVQAELLAVGTRGGSQKERAVLGSTVERVLRKAPVPVLVVKKELSPSPSLVLSPTDFSSAARPAVVEAAALARRWGARLVLLHAVEPIAETYVWPVESGTVALYLAEPEELDPEWEAFVAPLDLSGIAWERKTIRGYATQTITENAAQLGADLIVMGTHGRSGLAHVLLGSVAERVAREASCSILTVRPQES